MKHNTHKGTHGIDNIWSNNGRRMNTLGLPACRFNPCLFTSHLVENIHESEQNS